MTIYLCTTIARRLYCDLPGCTAKRAASRRSLASRLHPVWSSSGWGLPSRHSHLYRWCALTAPFHPYHASISRRTVRRFTLCCTFPNLAAGRRYRPSCPMEPGLSSSRLPRKPTSDHPVHSQTLSPRMTRHTARHNPPPARFMDWA